MLTMMLFGFHPVAWNNGRTITDPTLREGIIRHRDAFNPLLKQLADESLGARKEFWTNEKNCYIHPTVGEWTLSH